MSRRYAVFGADNVLLSETWIDTDWISVRRRRLEHLNATDFYYFGDKWDTLNTYEKGVLNAYRKALRDLPQDYGSANDAWDAMETLVEEMPL